MTRPPLHINGVPCEPGPRYARPEPPKSPVRPGFHPQCCGAEGAGNGGHEPHCIWRPTQARIFDHLAGGAEDARFSRAARAMRGEPWWRGIPIIVGLDDVSGECGK